MARLLVLAAAVAVASAAEPVSVSPKNCRISRESDEIEFLFVRLRAPVRFPPFSHAPSLHDCVRAENGATYDVTNLGNPTAE